MIVFDHTKHRHEAAHTGACDTGTLTIRVGAVFLIDHRLDLIHDPLKSIITDAVKFTAKAGWHLIRTILI